MSEFQQYRHVGQIEDLILLRVAWRGLANLENMCIIRDCNFSGSQVARRNAEFGDRNV